MRFFIGYFAVMGFTLLLLMGLRLACILALFVAAVPIDDADALIACYCTRRHHNFMGSVFASACLYSLHWLLCGIGLYF